VARALAPPKTCGIGEDAAEDEEQLRRDSNAGERRVARGHAPDDNGSDLRTRALPGLRTGHLELTPAPRPSARADLLQLCVAIVMMRVEEMPHASTLAILVQSFIGQAIGYFAVVGTVYAAVWGWGRERFKRARVPGPRRVDSRQLRREVAQTFVTLLAGTTSAGAVVGLHAAGLAKLSDAPVSPWTVGAWVGAGILFNDAWFYGWHRLLHHPRLFRHIHVVHHKSLDVNPFTSYSFHAAEAVLLGAWIVPAAVVLPIPMAALGALQVIGLANNVMAHLGYEFLPAWLLKVPVLRWTNTATFHSLHHTRSRGNFGLHTRLWDRVFGTEIAEYEQVFVARGNAEASADSRAEAS
jgi:lathosterol oxidase